MIGIEQEWADEREAQAKKRKEFLEKGKNILTGFVDSALHAVAPVSNDDKDRQTATSEKRQQHQVVHNYEVDDEEEEMGWGDESSEEGDNENNDMDVHNTTLDTHETIDFVAVQNTQTGNQGGVSRNEDASTVQQTLIKALQDEKRNLEGIVRAQELELDDLKQSIKSFATEVDSDDPGHLEQISALKLELSEAKEEINALKESHKNVILEEKLIETEGNVVRLRQVLDGKDDEINLILQQHSTEVASLKGELEELNRLKLDNEPKIDNGSNTNVSSEFEAYRVAKEAEITQLQADLGNVENDTSQKIQDAIKSEQLKLEDKLQTELAKSKDDCVKQLESLRNNLTESHSSKVAKLLSQIDESQNKINELEASVESLVSEKTEVEEKLHNCINALSRSKEESSDKSEYDEQRHEFDTYKEKTKAEQTELERKCRETTELYNSSCESANRLQDEFNSYKEAKEAEIERLQVEISNFVSSSEVMRTSITEIEQEFEAYRVAKEAEITQLQADLGNVENDTSQKIQDAIKSEQLKLEDKLQTELAKSKDDCVKQLESLRNNLTESHSSKVAKLLSQIDESQNKINELEASVESLVSEKTEVESKLQECLNTKLDKRMPLPEDEVESMTKTIESNSRQSANESQPSSESSAVNIDVSALDESYVTTESSIRPSIPTVIDNGDIEEEDDWGDAWGDEDETEEL